MGARVKLALRHISDDFEVEIEDVGVGISQIIPVLCAIEGNCRVYIQQPELHLHPKHQSHLGDIFIERVNSELSDIIDFELKRLPEASYCIETHSEHILLRILRRIRENYRSDIKNKLFSFSASQLSVLYVDRDDNGDSKVIHLRVADDGTFIDRWPHGFFTERDVDLFDE
jgi:predicted ATPase